MHHCRVVPALQVRKRGGHQYRAPSKPHHVPTGIFPIAFVGQRAYKAWLYAKQPRDLACYPDT